MSEVAVLIGYALAAYWAVLVLDRLGQIAMALKFLCDAECDDDDDPDDDDDDGEPVPEVEEATPLRAVGAA